MSKRVRKVGSIKNELIAKAKKSMLAQSKFSIILTFNSNPKLS